MRLISVFVRLLGGAQNEEQDLEQERVPVVVYPFTEKFPLESKWNAAFWVVPAENLWEQWNIWKGSPVPPDGMFQTENCVPFLQGHVDTSFRPSWSFSGKRNWFAQMVNAIPGRNLPVPNFAYHLPKLWTDWFVHVNGKQPLSYFTNYLRPLANNLRECYGKPPPPPPLDNMFPQYSLGIEGLPTINANKASQIVGSG